MSLAFSPKMQISKQERQVRKNYLLDSEKRSLLLKTEEKQKLVEQMGLKYRKHYF